jgi:hypothetical protein
MLRTINANLILVTIQTGPTKSFSLTIDVESLAAAYFMQRQSNG